MQRVGLRLINVFLRKLVVSDRVKSFDTGGHISIGLGDYPYAEYGAPTNAELIRRVREQAESMGREIATLEETREMLGM